MHTTVILKSDDFDDELNVYYASTLEQFGIELKRMTLIFDEAAARKLAAKILELVPEPEPEPEAPFKVGDRVVAFCVCDDKVDRYAAMVTRVSCPGWLVRRSDLRERAR
jgi:hypothetical protein